VSSVSVSASGLGGRYASALFDLAKDADALDAVGTDLEGLKQLLAESDELRRLVRSPVLSRAAQAKAMVALAEHAGCHELTRKFLGLLAQKRRLFALDQVIETYDAMLRDHRGEVGAELVSAVALSDEQIETVKKQLSAAAGRTVTLVTRVDPELLGGIVVRLGSRMIDASVRTRLHQLELAMKGAA
jgi:F-type H+-transporting ATPase subunit delta